MENHKIAEIFPLMGVADFESLVADIKANGLIESIYLYEGKILDGRNRYKACQEAEVEPHFTRYAKDDPLGFVISLNLKRRHLNESQRAVIASRLAMLQDGQRADYNRSANLPTLSQPEAAKMLNVSERIIRTVKAIERKAPELIPNISNGSITAHEALKIIKIKNREDEIKKQVEKIEAGGLNLPQGLYEVVVIDPPWPYGTKYDPYGMRGTCPYPEMSIEDLQKLVVPCTEDGVLFLWTTHKFIWDANELLDWWGFAYRNIIVWDKVKLGIGKLFRLQCEFCLVGLKGSPVFNNDNTHRDIIEESRREHSRKPECFYDMVDRLCIGRKLDMFGRETRKGWDMWGVEKWDNSETT